MKKRMAAPYSIPAIGAHLRRILNLRLAAYVQGRRTEGSKEMKDDTKNRGFPSALERVRSRARHARSIGGIRTSRNAAQGVTGHGVGQITEPRDQAAQNDRPNGVTTHRVRNLFIVTS